MNVQANKVGGKLVLALIILVSHYFCAQGLQYVNQPRGSLILTKAKPQSRELSESRPMTLCGASNKAHTLLLTTSTLDEIRLHPPTTASHRVPPTQLLSHAP